MAESTVKSMTLLPEYQEKFLKDLLSNIYRVDEDTGEVGGIASRSPLFGQPVLDEAGVQMYQKSDGTFTSDVNLAMKDQYGEPILAVEGGVAAPDVIRFTDPQKKSIELLTGVADPTTGKLPYSGIGAYKPFLTDARDTYSTGISAAEGSMGMYDPQGQVLYDTVTDPKTGVVTRTARTDPTTGELIRTSGYKDFYDPFVEEVIDTTLADIQRAGDIQKIGERAQAVGSGAFGGSRQAIAEQELQRNIEDQKARTGAQLRSAAYTGAQQQAQSAFENQMKRGQTGAQLFQTLGTGLGALGEASQQLGQRDVNALFNVGQLEQGQLQREFDVQREGQLEEAYEPFARFSFMRDILKGQPGASTTLAATGVPQRGSLGNILAGANTASAAAGGGQLFGLGSLMNVSGA